MALVTNYRKSLICHKIPPILLVHIQKSFIVVCFSQLSHRKGSFVLIFKLVRGLQNPYTFPQNMIGNRSFCQVQGQDHNPEMRGFLFLEKKHVSQEYIQIQSDSMEGFTFLKSVHFKKPVTQISFLSKALSFSI